MHRKRYPRVTIGIPTYNRVDNYFRQTLRSALSQTYDNIEVVVSDNCSSDNTEAYVKKLNESRIRYFRQSENIGANNNFNFCLKQAKGKYFLLLLDDDLIDADFIETCMEALDSHGEIGIVRTGTRVIDSDGHFLNDSPNMDAGLSLKEFFREWLAWRTSLYLCSTLFNTKSLREIGGFRSRHNLFQDVLAEFQLSAQYGRLDVQDIKASFRKHSSAMTSSAKIKHWCEDSLFLLDAMCALLPEDVATIKKKGLHFFCEFNIRLSKTINSPLSRLTAYLEILRYFKFTFLSQNVNSVFHESSKHSFSGFIEKNLRRRKTS